MCIKTKLFVFALVSFSNKHYPLNKDHNLELLNALKSFFQRIVPGNMHQQITKSKMTYVFKVEQLLQP